MQTMMSCVFLFRMVSDLRFGFTFHHYRHSFKLCVFSFFLNQKRNVSLHEYDSDSIFLLLLCCVMHFVYYNLEAKFYCLLGINF